MNPDTIRNPFSAAGGVGGEKVGRVGNWVRSWKISAAIILLFSGAMGMVKGQMQKYPVPILVVFTGAEERLWMLPES